MPVIDSDFRSALFLSNGHVQTIVPALRPRRFALSYTRERLELPDGDFLDLDWAPRQHRRLVIISHGLEGHSSDSYIRGTAAACKQAGWDALAWNFRSCSGVPNRLPRFYHSGATEDLLAVIQYAAQFYSILALVGFSLGGNLTLKYLGESVPHSKVQAAVAVSVPVDLASTACMLDTAWGNRIYLRRLIGSLKKKIQIKAQHFPQHFDLKALETVRGFADFDHQFTAPVHGFDSAEDYWTRCSARQFLPAIPIPTLLLNARNDPFLAVDSFPTPEAEANHNLFLEVPPSGGHLGFLPSFSAASMWFETRIVEFLNQSIAE